MCVFPKWLNKMIKKRFLTPQVKDKGLKEWLLLYWKGVNFFQRVMKEK